MARHRRYSWLSLAAVAALGLTGHGRTALADAGTTAYQARIQAAVDHFNALIRPGGAGPYRLDATLSARCRAHAEYLVHNLSRQPGLAAHLEYADRPGFTTIGSNNGGIAYTRDPVQAINVWMATYYHRLKTTGTGRIGIGSSRVCTAATQTVDDNERPADPYGLFNDYAFFDGGDDLPVCYPFDGQTGVDLQFQPEVPNPLPADIDPYAVGFPITVILPERGAIRLRQATLSAGGHAVPLWTRTDGARIGLFPRQFLAPGTTYTVQMTVENGPTVWQHAWQFHTVSQ